MRPPLCNSCPSSIPPPSSPPSLSLSLSSSPYNSRSRLRLLTGIRSTSRTLASRPVGKKEKEEMMSRGAVELDFLGMAEKEIGSPSAASGPRLQQQRRPLGRLSSFRGIQSAISRIPPELLKSVIFASSGAAGRAGSAENAARLTSFSVPSTPKPDLNAAPASPVYAPLVRPSSETHGEVAPLTIFYGGTVAVFDLPPSKAENILKLAVQGIPKSAGPESREAAATTTGGQEQLLGIGDLPLTRKKSLERFFEKRKERLTSASPYSRDK